MDRITQLKAEREKLRKEIGALLAAATKDDRSLSQEERDKSDSLQAEMDGFEATMALEEKHRDWQRHDAKAIERVEPAEPAAPEYEPYAEIGEQLMAVHADRFGTDPRLRAATGLSEGVPADGGFLVQTDFATELNRKAFETGLLASRCRVHEVGANSNGLKLNLVNETSRVSSRYGGIIAYWKAEAQVKAASQPEFRQWDYSLSKLIGLWYATDELLQDATALTSVVNGWFADEFGFQLDEAIYNGNGVGRPLGILNAPCLVTVPKEGGQLAATVVANNVYRMYARMPAGSLTNAVWCISQTVWPQLFQLSQAVGVGGVPLFIPAGGINQAPAGTLLGRPIVPIEQASVLGTVGDIAFCDWSQYLTIRKGGIAAASSIHVNFLYDESVFRFVMRFNGAPIPSAALTPFKGGAANTISPFIVLAVRA